MTSKKTIPTAPSLFQGRQEQATYIQAELPLHRGNMLIEALPAPLTKAEVANKLTLEAPYDEAQRQLPEHLRTMITRTARRFFQPISRHFLLESQISTMIREGYVERDPLKRDFWLDSVERARRVSLHGSFDPMGDDELVVTDGMIFIGISGMGKTTSVKRILRLYPQVIYHSTYNEQPCPFQQVVWLMLECPRDGSIKALLQYFFRALDRILGTKYFLLYTDNGRATVTNMLEPMAMLCNYHGIGALVIDEVQNIDRASSGGEQEMLNFFVELMNTVGIPVLLIGTPQALGPLSGQFRIARRGSGQGDVVWDAMQFDDDWHLFLESLWLYQYVQHDSPLTEQLSKAVYDVSTGITDTAIKVYMFAQEYAINTGEERVTENIIRLIPAARLQLSEPVLSARRSRRTGSLPNVKDIHLTHLETFIDVPKSEGSILSHGQQRRNTQATQMLRIEGNIIDIVVRGKESNLSRYDALYKAGYIISPMELFEPSA